jgi:hypothetical protein
MRNEWCFIAVPGRSTLNAWLLDAWTVTAQTESTYDWGRKQWSVPLNLLVSRVTKIGGQLVSVGGGLRYWAEGPEGGPHGLGVRLVVTLLFPK